MWEMPEGCRGEGCEDGCGGQVEVKVGPAGMG